MTHGPADPRRSADGGPAGPDEPAATGDQPTFTHRPGRHGLIGPFSGRQLGIAVLAVVVVAGVLVIGTIPIGPPGPSTPVPDPRATQFLITAPPEEGLRIGDRAPELSFTRDDGSTFTLADLDGRPIRLAALRGRPVWINFWASWCPPCQAETPILREVYRAYEDRGLVLLAISVQESTAADVRAYAERYELPYTIAADLTGDVFRRYGVFGLPTQLFLDGDGVIRGIVQGPVSFELAIRQLNAIVPTAQP